MNKLLAFLLALSVGATAFADTYQEGIDNTQSRTQTITVNAPALTWTLEIPANLEIEFGNTDLIEMGNLKISDVSWPTLPGENFIYVYASNTPYLIGKTSSSTIAYELSCQYHYQTEESNGEVLLSSLMRLGADGDPTATHHSSTVYRWADMYIQIPAGNWSAAVPGETYEGTITYSSQYGTWF